MIHQIDLHGLSHNRAVAKVEAELISISLSSHWEVEIITGKSKAMQDKIIKEVLVPQNFFYYIPTTNPGMIITLEDDLLS